MKKLILESSDIDAGVTANVNEFIASHFMYGLYDFDVEKLCEDICRIYKLGVHNVEPPLIVLHDESGNELVLKFVEEHYM